LIGYRLPRLSALPTTLPRHHSSTGLRPCRRRPARIASSISLIAGLKLYFLGRIPDQSHCCAVEQEAIKRSAYLLDWVPMQSMYAATNTRSSQYCIQTAHHHNRPRNLTGHHPDWSPNLKIWGSAGPRGSLPRPWSRAHLPSAS
jgi:hypothetical protein